MRVASDQHGFQGTRHEPVFEVLGQQTQPPRDLASVMLVEWYSIHQDSAASGFAQSGKRVQSECLAAAVTSEDGNKLALSEFNRQVAQQLPCAHPDGNLLGDQRWG